MSMTRRHVLALGGGGLIAFTAAGPALAARTHVIAMVGTPRGERVWFSPAGLAVDPGAIVRFVNRDPANSHTATAYHPDLYGRPRRIPEGAAPWHSGFLLPGEHFEVTMHDPGVWDYYCIPHEMAGMVGRIVVGRPGHDRWQGPPGSAGNLPEAALAAFPDVDRILAFGHVEAEHRP